jgi:hypothetical protein
MSAPPRSAEVYARSLTLAPLRPAGHPGIEAGDPAAVVRCRR